MAVIAVRTVSYTFLGLPIPVVTFVHSNCWQRCVEKEYCKGQSHVLYFPGGPAPIQSASQSLPMMPLPGSPLQCPPSHAASSVGSPTLIIHAYRPTPQLLDAAARLVRHTACLPYMREIARLKDDVYEPTDPGSLSAWQHASRPHYHAIACAFNRPMGHWEQLGPLLGVLRQLLEDRRRQRMRSAEKDAGGRAREEEGLAGAPKDLPMTHGSAEGATCQVVGIRAEATADRVAGGLPAMASPAPRGTVPSADSPASGPASSTPGSGGEGRDVLGSGGETPEGKAASRALRRLQWSPGGGKKLAAAGVGGGVREGPGPVPGTDLEGRQGLVKEGGGRGGRGLGAGRLALPLGTSQMASERGMEAGGAAPCRGGGWGGEGNGEDPSASLPPQTAAEAGGAPTAAKPGARHMPLEAAKVGGGGAAMDAGSSSSGSSGSSSSSGTSSSSSSGESGEAGGTERGEMEVAKRGGPLRHLGTLVPDEHRSRSRSRGRSRSRERPAGSGRNRSGDRTRGRRASPASARTPPPPPAQPCGHHYRTPASKSIPQDTTTPSSRKIPPVSSRSPYSTPRDVYGIDSDLYGRDLKRYERQLYRLLYRHPGGLTLFQIRQQLPIPRAILVWSRPSTFLLQRPQLFTQTVGGRALTWGGSAVQCRQSLDA